MDAEKCTACGACAKACPRGIIEIRPKGRVVKGEARRVWVGCVNKDKGAIAAKACAVSCIGCGKCQKVCKKEAITIENNLAYIDPAKCIACGLCFNECPKHAIHASFAVPVPRPKVVKPAEEPAAPKAAAKPVAAASEGVSAEPVQKSASKEVPAAEKQQQQ